jgi:hypothetical protein
MRFVDQEQIHFTLALEDAETKSLKRSWGVARPEEFRIKPLISQFLFG